MKSNLNSINGTIIKTLRVDGITLIETAYERDLKLPTHTHREPYFCFILSGGCTETFGRLSRMCKKADLIFHPANEGHSDYFHDSTRCFNVKLDPFWLDKKTSIIAPFSSRTDFICGMPDNILARLYREFQFHDQFSELIIQGLILEILGNTSRQNTSPPNRYPPEWLVKTRECLRDSFPEKPSLTELSATYGVHETHLSRSFQRHFGITIGEFYRQLRIEDASRRLADSNSPLAEIALSAGFYDQSHFARSFKEHTGMSPMEFRRNYQ